MSFSLFVKMKNYNNTPKKKENVISLRVYIVRNSPLYLADISN